MRNPLVFMRVASLALLLSASIPAPAQAAANGAPAIARPSIVGQRDLQAVVSATAFSPAGDVLAVVYYNDLALYEVNSGLLLRTIHYQAGYFSTAAFTADGQEIFLGGQRAAIFNTRDGKLVRAFDAGGQELAGAFLYPDEKRVMTVHTNHTIHVFQTNSGKEIGQPEAIPSGSEIERLVLAPDAKKLAFVLRNDQILHVWDATAMHELFARDLDLGELKVLSFSPTGNRILAAGETPIMHVLDARSGETLHTIDVRELPQKAIEGTALDGKVRTLLHHDRRLEAWDIATGKALNSAILPLEDAASIKVAFADFLPDGQRIFAISNANYRSGVWRISDGTRESIAAFEEDIPDIAMAHYALSLGTGKLAVDRNIYDLQTGKKTGLTVTDNATSFDVRALTAADWALLEREGNPEVLNHGSAFGSLLDEARDSYDSTSSKASHYAIALPDGDPRDGARISLLRRTEGVAAPPAVKLESLARAEADTDLGVFSTDGRYLAGKTQSLFYVVRTSDASIVHVAASDLPLNWCCAFSPGGKYAIATTCVLAEGAAAVAIETATGRTQSFPIGSQLGCIRAHAFSPDGEDLFVAASYSGDIYEWSLETGKQLHHFADPIKQNFQEYRSLALNADGRLLLSISAEEPVIFVWNTETGELIKSFDFGLSFIDSATLSPDGRFALASGEGQTSLIDLDAGKLEATIFAFRSEQKTSSAHNDGLANDAPSDQDWAVVAPDGRFDTSNFDTGGTLHWVTNDDPFRAVPIEIFMREYYTPRLLGRILNSEQLPPIRSIAEIKDRTQPRIEIVRIGASTSQPGRADVVVRAASIIDSHGIASGLADLKLFRDGQLVGFRAGALPDGEFTFKDIRLPAATRKTTFTAYAFNAEQIKSATVAKDYAYKLEATAHPRAWLVQIGVNHYQAAGCDLHGAVRDAQTLSAELSRRLTARGFEVHALTLLSSSTQSSAGKHDIRQALASVAAQSAPDDAFFLSFSGHGFSDRDGRFFILPADIRGSCSAVDESLLASAISADELTDWLRLIDAGQMTFILDACDSASSVDANGFKPGPMGSRGLGQLAYDKRMRILAASQPNQAARESADLGQGLLTWALTQEGLVERKADWRPHDQRITVGEWLAYAAQRVPQYLEAGNIKGPRGLVPVGQPLKQVPSIQTPIVFDFSKSDVLKLQ